jgi:transaldolase
MPPATLEAVSQIATQIVDAVTPNFAWARSLLDEVTTAGVDLTDVAATLEREGVDKFVAAWEALLARLECQLRDGTQAGSGSA